MGAEDERCRVMLSIRHVRELMSRACWSCADNHSAEVWPVAVAASTAARPDPRAVGGAVRSEPRAH